MLNYQLSQCVVVFQKTILTTLVNDQSNLIWFADYDIA